MKREIKIRNLRGSGEISDYIDHRLSFAFARMEQEVDRITITLEDTNGPKGGIDKQCRVMVKPTQLEPFVVSEINNEVDKAIDKCLSRASETLIRKLKRRQMRFRKGALRNVSQRPLPSGSNPYENAY